MASKLIIAWPVIRIFVFFFCFIPSVILSADQKAFTAKGELHYEAYQANGTNLAWTRSFTVAVQNCSWLIESRDLSSGEFEFNAFADGLMHTVTKVNPENNPSLNNYYEIIESDSVPPSEN